MPRCVVLMSFFKTPVQGPVAGPSPARAPDGGSWRRPGSTPSPENRPPTTRTPHAVPVIAARLRSRQAGDRREPCIESSRVFACDGITVRPKQGRERVRGWPEWTMFSGVARRRRKRARNGAIRPLTTRYAAIRPPPGNAIKNFFPRTAMSYRAQHPVAGSRLAIVAAFDARFSPA